jgi:ABC-type polysaccharide/polyol phosphate transport system ATPase subunit
MISTTNSDILLSVKKLRVYFELQHYHHQSLRDVFVTAISNPIDYIFKTPDLYYAVDDISFDLTRGARLGIIGVNGAGKTTLCRCLAGMMKAQQGEVKTYGDVRAIFDTGTGIMPDLTGRENAFLLARLFFPYIQELATIVEESISFSELGHFIDIPFRQYSKGMQSRLLLSLISAVPTDILILDEVFDGADVFFQQKLAKRMKNLIEQAGATIFVSHSYAQLEQVCNQVMVLNKGKIAFLGDVKEGWQTYLHLENEKGPVGP